MTARQIILEGGSPWGFRMHGGADVQQPLRISRVNPGSKAAARGVREGDVITTINGESTRNKTNSEAHALLKSAGNTLKLGLNQDCIGGSPKKRQYNNSNDNNTTSTQQEVLTETIKRSNIITKFIISSSSTSTSSSATTTTTNLRTETPTTDNPASNRNEISKENSEKNGFKLNGDSSIKPTPKDYYFSDRSTISSNYSSAASTPSTLTESQVSSSPSTQQRDDQITMSDSGSSRSRRRKRPNAKGKRPVPEESNYRVESPKTVLQKRKSSLTKKSKSLDDDDDSIEIREVCETGECSAHEDDSDPIIWEVVEDMNVNQIPNETVKVTMTRTLKLEDKAELQSITPEDETKLRCFLEGLQLVSTPEEAANMAVQSRESAESIKARRAKKREELAQYFLPVYQNPRFLDVISEENSDQSDKEQKERTISQRTIITETDSARIPIISDTCTTSMAQTGSSVEIVYLEDSSGCESESAESVEDPHADAVDVKDVLSSQLTPPPTPDEKLEEIRRISKETVMPHQNSQIQCFNLHEIEGDKTPQIPMQRVNVVSPSHLSECSGDSSSRGTSLCTTIYRDELPNDMLSLRELCLKKLISLPFGRDVLEELASVSESLEELTNNLSSTHQLHHNNSNNTASSSVKLTQNTTEDRFNTSDGFDISAVSTEAKAPVGTKNLLDLHEKFAQIRGNHQNTVDESPSNRLLAFIRGSDASESTTAKSGGHVPEQRFLDERSGDEARLDARNLSEWLNLARAKSGSVPHLNNLDDMKDPLPKRDEISARRRRSLPQEIYVQQMQYLIQKEKEIQQELEKLEEEKRKLASEMNTTGDQHQFDPTQYKISKNQDIAIHQPNPSKSTIPPESERFRQNMYDEYMTQIAKRQDRQQHKVIKISSHQLPTTEKKGKLEAIHVKGIEDEFMNKVKQRKLKYAAATSEDSADYASLPERSDAEDSEPVLVMDGDSLSEAKRLPKHLKEFVAITREAASNLDTEDGIWSPGSQKDPTSSPEGSLHVQRSLDQDTEPIPPVWAPKSAGSSPSLERKEFRSVNFGSPVLGRKNKEGFSENTSVDPPWRNPSGSSDISVALSSSLEKRIPNSYSAPGFSDFPNSRLPKAQNPTITLLQKARGGHLPKGAAYIEQDSNPHLSRHDPSPPKLAPGEIVYEIKHEYTSESENERPKKMADLSQRKYPMGIGPTTKDGMPLTLRSEVKDQNQSKWYKRMYDTIHKQKPRYDDDYVTVRYKQRRGRYPYNSGYLSEPEPGAYDSDASIYDHRVTTLDRRRAQPAPANGAGGDDNYVISYTMPRSSTNSYIPQTSTIIKHGKEVYKNQPGRIENYVPGRSSISDKEAKEWWDEVMDIFDGHLEQQKHTPHKGYMSQALKESGYESDSTLVFRRRDENINQLSPSEQREAYKTIQRGGDVPLHGLRKPAPERPKEPDAPTPPPKGLSRRASEPESPRKYVENEVTIHYRTPVRQEIKEALSEDELQRRQAEHMKKIYQEERRRKYLQELQDMHSRRHADNFTPSQKSPIPLNRYDDFLDDYSPKLKPRPRSPEPRLVAKALYNFVGQSARELTFRKGDIIYIRRQVDKNWYEGEHNAMVGLFPANYVEIVPYDGVKTTVRKPHEGQARAKYNFIAQTHLELSLAKGELVVITRKVDDNWFEGKIGGRKGIFPVSYVDVLIDPGTPPQSAPSPTKPVAAPAAHSLLLNGSSGGKESMGAHNYVPPFHGSDSTPSYHAKPVQVTGSGTYGSLSRTKNLNQALHIDTQSEPVPYRALYKYKPQNEDELELLEGDTVYVLEKCDDGWYVGSSDRTGAFGTFPGNYVERI